MSKCYVTRYYPFCSTNAATGERSWGIAFEDYRDGERFNPAWRDGYQGHYGDKTPDEARARCKRFNHRDARILCETPEGRAQYRAWLLAERERRRLRDEDIAIREHQLRHHP